MYHVYFGNYMIYGAETVNGASDRDITIYNGLGQGNFPIGDDKNLRTWTLSAQLTERNEHGFEGWEPAKNIFSGLEKMLASKEPERIVITSAYGKMSELVLIESYSYDETSPGVYDVAIKLVEYKKVGPRTTGIPAITRPGKIPVMPTTVVFKTSTQVAGDAIERKKMTLGSTLLDYAYQTNMGKWEHTTNPNLVPTGVEIKLEEIKSTTSPGLIQDSMISKLQYDVEYEKYLQGQSTQGQSSKNGNLIKDTFSAISDAFKKFKEANAKSNAKSLY